ncbi:ATP-dependent DNA helicase RecQ-like [Montipora capricornis]|uniref:ATP-dependent DNA helicase RecQ-like n=1 Tax=Montipora capricornis TaxID=246305 RepID=UPI0035F17E99
MNRATSTDAKTSVVVVSPLEYIRKQQVENLRTANCGISAATIGESIEMDREIANGKFDIVYGSAEQWLSESWRKTLQCGNLHRAEVLVVDEVHTVATWGSGKKGKAAFREAFGRVSELRSCLKSGTPVLGLTATANKELRDRLIKCLGIRSPLGPIIVSPNKDNIRFTVAQADKKLYCFNWLLQLLREKKGDAPFTIIFCKTVNDIVSLLTYFVMKLEYSGLYVDGEGPPHERCLLGVYYSQTPTHHKDHLTSSFEGKSGHVIVVFATTSLSMGVDFPFVKYVVRYGPSNNLTSHLQEAGRAGRNGQQAYNTTVCCSVCHRKFSCLGDGSGCSETIPEFDSWYHNEKDHVVSRGVTEDDKNCIRDALKEVQVSLSSETKVRMFDNTGVITHGLSDNVIDAVVSNVHFIFNVHSVLEQCNVPSLKLAVIILEVVKEVFEDFEIPEELYSAVTGRKKLHLASRLMHPLTVTVNPLKELLSEGSHLPGTMDELLI